MQSHPTEIRPMLETAIVAARLAGQRAIEELRYTRSTMKSQDELVTQADPICQKIIMDRIKESYPDHGFIAEEGSKGKLLRLSPRGDQHVWWIIDPIDGTNNFANGLLCFSVSIAALIDGHPAVGVIFDPATDSMYTAAVDCEAQLNGSRITVNKQALSIFSSIGIDSHHNPQTAEGIFEIMQKTRPRCLGSTALHIAYIAKGAMIGAVTNRARLWDIAAGALILKQAGGATLSLDSQSPFPVDCENYNSENYSLLLSNQKALDELKTLFQIS